MWERFYKSNIPHCTLPSALSHHNALKSPQGNSLRTTPTAKLIGILTEHSVGKWRADQQNRPQPQSFLKGRCRLGRMFTEKSKKLAAGKFLSGAKKLSIGSTQMETGITIHLAGRFLRDETAETQRSRRKLSVRLINGLRPHKTTTASAYVKIVTSAFFSPRPLRLRGEYSRFAWLRINLARFFVLFVAMR